ncbi:uncharacterized protein YscB-like isoform X2 [Dermacentor albipictus]|uniref:uncharacterized protein YscB-like isoform X2 n=1 Tax=Dermacentor albipictus TaxID=60249 RepID=UPI0038FCF252
MENESEIAAQQRRRAEKLNSSDPEVVAWQLAVERRKNEQKKAKRAAETPEQREERLEKRRRQEAERRARPSRQLQQDAVDDAKARRLTDYTSQALQSQVPTPSSDGSSYTSPQVQKCQCCCHPVMSSKAVQTALPQFRISTQTSSNPLQFSQAHLCRCCCHYSMSSTAMQTALDLKQLATSSSHSQTTESCLLVSRRNAGVQVHLGAYICLSVASQTTFC